MTELLNAPKTVKNPWAFLRALPLLGVVIVSGLALLTQSGRHYSLATAQHLGPLKAREWVIEQCREGKSFDIDLIMVGATDSAFEIRQKSILALDRNGERAGPAIPLLIQLTKTHEDYRTRGLAVHALGKVTEQYESVGAAILGATKDENVNVVIAAGMSADSLKSKLKAEIYLAIQAQIERQIIIHSSGVKTLRLPDKSR